MGNSRARDGDTAKLHPAIRDKVLAIRAQLQKEKIPFEVFEAFRTPERQADLFAQGRTKPGAKVTWAGPWRSIHQYGLAVDFVLKINGKWSWDTSGPEAQFWPRMHALAKDHGMTPLFNKAGKLIEKPHIQLVDIRSSELARGQYPDGGDAIWAEHLEELIANWEGGGAPPKPSGAPRRPALPDEDIADMEDDAATLDPAKRAAIEEARTDTRFQGFHAFVKRWEGGFVNDPRDDGGATNMGITRATLSDWRGRDVSVEDVAGLSRAEADAILRTNYYSRCRCGELPDRVAMVVYNGAVLHGSRRSVEFLQRAFNDLGLLVNGAPLEVDGVIGRLTVGASKSTDPAALSGAYMDIQEQYFRQHHDFGAFGTGWLNRLAALREFVNTLPAGTGQEPRDDTTVTERLKDRFRDIRSVFGLDLEADDMAGLEGVGMGKAARKRVLPILLGEVLAADPKDDSRTRQRKELLAAILARSLTADSSAPGDVPVTPDGKAPLTPVNAALGETLGRLLNGKKSVIGVVGLLATVLIPNLGLSGATVALLEQHTSEILTVLATFTGWGFLGKIDKAIWTLKQEVRAGP